MKKDFLDQVVVVTGASAGIGRATALMFAEAGASVVLISRNEERLISLQQQIESMGRRSMKFAIDVADSQAILSAVDSIEKNFGAIDVWVNNAMVSVFSPIKEMMPEEYKRVTEVTYLGYVYATLAVLKKMQPRNRGVIVQVGSALAYRGIPLQSAYCAAKHAVKGFHDSLVSELMHDGSNANVTMVQLPAHNTPQFDWVKSRLPNRAQPVPPIFQPEVAARAIMHAAKHPRREWVVGWSAYKAIWVNKFFPRLIDLYLSKTGYKSQQTNEPRDVSQPDNLFNSVQKNVGAHGRFDARARKKSFFFLLTVHRNIFFITLMLLALLFLFLKFIR